MIEVIEETEASKEEIQGKWEAEATIKALLTMTQEITEIENIEISVLHKI